MNMADDQKLMRLSEFAPFAVENLSDGAFLIAKDASILYVNHAACAQLGYTEDELIGMTIFDINPHLTRAIWDSVWGVTVTDKFQAIETEHQTKDGRMVPFEVLANYFEIGGVQFSCTFTRDITKRKEMESRIRQAEKMEAIGQLAGGIAHDFNNQLSGILGFASLLKNDLVDKPEQKRFAEGIIAAGQRSAELTAQLLAFSRQGNYLSIPVNVHALIDETVNILTRSIDKNIKITTHYGAAQPVVTGDPTQLENAFLNLAINARDAMPSGGELLFSTDMVELDNQYCAHSLFKIRPGPYVQIRVVDTGVGMSDDTLKRIFEPFFTTKQKGKGTGMGLASVYGTIKTHKGAIDVFSQPGKGTEFVLYFLPADFSQQFAGKTDASEVPQRISASVLLADDEPLVRDSLKTMLEWLGCRVATAENGAEAVSLYKRSFRDIDIVILDLIMPEMGGKEAFLKMREINPGIKAIVSSGYSLQGEIQDILHAGARGFIQKPFEVRELAQKLSALLTAD
jgi:PAS domain S-box-containing protein